MIPHKLNYREETTKERRATARIEDSMTVERLLALLNECVELGMPLNADVELKISKIDGFTTFRAYSSCPAQSSQQELPQIVAPEEL